MNEEWKWKCVKEEENINQELKDKLHSCQIENQLLREEIKNKQKQ